MGLLYLLHKGVVNIIGGAGELLLRLLGNTFHVPSVWCWSVYLSAHRLCVVCGWES
jgi:hypothetical protein